MLVFVERQVALALGFTCAEESISRGELGHQQAAGAFFVVLENRLRILLRAVSDSRLRPLRSIFRNCHHVLRTAHKAGIANKAAEDRVRHAGHRSENCGGSNANIADLERFRHSRPLRGDSGVSRVFPEFTHFSVIPTLSLPKGREPYPIDIALVWQSNQRIDECWP